jgi:antitoxin component of MazEF toxin-antitoxin module
MATQIIRTGGSVAVEIPEELLRQANLTVGDPVEWTLTPSGTLALQTPDSIDAQAPGSEDGYEEWKLRKMEIGFAAIDAGESVDGAKVREWLQSWGTEHELPSPR